METDRLLDAEKAAGATSAVASEAADVEAVKGDVSGGEFGGGKAHGRWRKIAAAFAPLGFVAFGGPQAHIALLHQRFVKATGELSVSDQLFVELFSLAQALPGPSSTQTVVALGIVFGGWLGGLAAFFVFQLPGFLAMSGFGLLLGSGGNGTDLLRYASLFTHGLIAAAFAQVTIAALSITVRVTGSDPLRRNLALISTGIAACSPPQAAMWLYPLLLVSGGLAAYLRDFLAGADVAPTAEDQEVDDSSEYSLIMSRNTGRVLLVLFTLITGFLLVFVTLFGEQLPRGLQLFDAYWRMGALVFGGGQVVLPMMLTEIVERGWLAYDVFLNGFALVQVMPGPLFNLAPFVGAAMLGPTGALIAALGMFAPGVMLVFAVLPFWAELRKSKLVRVCLGGVTAAAAGLINAAVYIFMEKSLSSRVAYAIAVIAGGYTLFFGYAAPVTIVGGGLLGSILISLNIGGPFCTVSWWTSRLDPESLAKVCGAI